jgi:hypothetical protein
MEAMILDDYPGDIILPFNARRRARAGAANRE